MDSLQNSLSGIQGTFNNLLDGFDVFTEKALGIVENVYAFRDIKNDGAPNGMEVAPDSANTTIPPSISGLSNAFAGNKGLVTAGLFGLGAIGVALLVRR